MPPNSPRGLDIVRHRVRGYRVPYLLVAQHHAIPATTRLAAPLSPPLPGEVDLLAPPVRIEGVEHRARMLDIAAVPAALLGEVVAPAAGDADAILGALDVILRGYPVELSRIEEG
jgi:hypothetical protein